MMPAHPRLQSWWFDDPADPGRLPLDDPDVQRLIDKVSPGACATDLGGVMSLNVGLGACGLVMRVHQPFVSRARLLALQAVRQALDAQGVLAPAPVPWQGAPLLRCRNRWAELETLLPHRQPPRTWEGYTWVFGALGELDAVLAGLQLRVPQPLVATYATPGSLRRWLVDTEEAVASDPQASESAALLRTLVGRLRRQWVPARQLPIQYVHGDGSPRNICRAPDGRPVYLDYGFFARRPRVHELGYALAFMLFALGAHESPERFAWSQIQALIRAYESAGKPLSAPERAALAPYTAAIPLYAAALDGYTEDPAGRLCARLPFLRLSEWLLTHPAALAG